MTSVRLCVAVLLVASACTRQGTGSDRVNTTAAVSNAIAAHPAASDSILKANGYTMETYQTALYEIAKDSAESVRYSAALRQ
jgi:hypothetical protein